MFKRHASQQRSDGRVEGVDASDIPTVSLLPRFGSVQHSAHTDFMLCLDDWIRQFFFLLHKARLWNRQVSSNDVAAQLSSDVTMPSHGQMYILYYICPLHTFYFLMTFGTMAVSRGKNHTKYGARAKIFATAIVIFIVWEIPGMFDKVWFFLSNKPHPGAPVGAYGVRYEWHFRSGLDHWSTLFGMIFAVGFPQATYWIKRVEQMSPAVEWANKGVVAVFLLAHPYGATVSSFSQTRIQQRPPVHVAIPLLTYIYFRNICPLFRQYH